MRISKVSLFLFIIYFAFISLAASAFAGDGPLIEATIVLDKKQTGEDADRELKISGINSEGFIQGSEGSQKHFILFKDIEKITFDLGTHAYTVTTWEGKTLTLKFAKLATHNTSPTFDCMAVDAKDSKPVEQNLDYTQIKSVVFKKGSAPASESSATEPSQTGNVPAAATTEPASENKSTPAAETVSKDQVIKYWKDMAEILDRNQEMFNMFQQLSCNSAEEYELWLGRMETFLKKDLGTIQTMLSNARQHGNTANDINNKWHEIVGADDPFNGSRNVDALIMNLEWGLKYIETGRKDAAASLLQTAEVELGNMSNFAEEIRPEIFKRNRLALSQAKRFEPENQAVAQWLSKIDDMETASAAQAEKAMNDFVFPDHIQGFAGPGNPEELAKAALEYFNSTCKPEEKAIKAVVNEKEWYCYKRNIFGEPTIWALTFMVAVQLDNEKDKDITRVWSISFLTEETPGVAKAPPFKSAAFNQSYKMRSSRLPK